MRRPLFFALLICAMSLALGACASARVPAGAVYPAAPAYEPSGPIPGTVALAVDETAKVQSRGKTRVNDPYGPMIASDLKKMKLFGNVVYPYVSGSPAGQKAVLHLAITGGWSYSSEDYTRSDWWAGRSQGHYAYGDHEVKITLTANGREIFNKTVPVKSDLEYRGGDEDQIAALLNQAQAERIAIAVSEEIEAHQAIIVAQLFNRPAYVATPYAAPKAGYAAPASQVAAPHPALPGPVVTGAEDAGIGKKLSELEVLHKQGVLSDADYNAARARLMDIRKLDDLYRTGVITLPEYRKALARIMQK